MLSITTVSVGQAGHYYSKDDYYAKAHGQWQGKGAELLGYRGEVSQEAFQRGVEGRDKDDHQLVDGNNANNGEHRAGLDLTFSAPKSVSILAEVLGDERVREAHEDAVSKTLEYIERNFSQTRLTKGGVTERVDTGNLVMAKFSHDTSRELDPQLHTHCVIMNMTQREDGRWRALSNEEVYHNKLLIGQYYRNELAANLKDLGYSIESDHRGLFEVQGFDRNLLDHFSQRSQQIEEKVQELKESGLYQYASEQKLREIATLGSRVVKQDTDMELVRTSWENRLQEQGYTKEAILEQLKDAAEKDKLSEAERKEPRPNGYDYIRLACKAQTEQESVFSKEEILKIAGKLAIGEKRLDELGKSYDELAKSKEIITLDKTNGLYTTKGMIKTEKDIVKRINAGHSQMKSVVDEEQAKKIIGEKYSHLTKGQSDSVVHILSSQDRVIGIQGDAGTGKTTMLQAVREQFESHGYSVQGVSYTGKAAAEIEKNSGIRSQTLHSFLGALESHRKVGGKDVSPENQVWIIDEASMIGSKQMAQLIKNAEKLDAKVVLIGDTKQLQAVEAGKMFSKLLENGALKTVRMSEVLRQKEESYKDVIKDISAKKIDSALNKLESQGRVYEIGNRKERFDAIVKDYLSRSHYRDVTIVTARNQDRNDLNAAIRAALKRQGKLQKAEHDFTVRESRNISPSDKLFAHAYRSGNKVIANRAGIIGRAGAEGEIVGIDQHNHALKVLTKDQKGNIIDLKTNGLHLATYAEKEQSFSQGDKVVFLKNDKELKVQNGMTGEVKVIAEKGNATVKLDDGRELHFNIRSQYNYIDHGYVVTDYKSQGQTAKEVIYHADTRKEVNYNQAYVAMTRGQDDVRVYTDNREEFRDHGIR